MFLVMFFTVLAVSPITASASAPTDTQTTSGVHSIIDIPSVLKINSETESVLAEPTTLSNLSLISPMAENPGIVAGLRIFASSDAAGSSLPSLDGHAWVVITNYQAGSITIGKLSGISQYKSLSIGTWGNESEHKGLWYNLEAQRVLGGAYASRVSLNMDLNASQLATVNSVIANNDSWSSLNNCSDFAIKVWNSVSSTSLNNGVFHTPTALRDSIKAQSWYTSGSPFSYDYLVYYAQGTGTPLRSNYY